jgi:hypothetical protein
MKAKRTQKQGPEPMQDRPSARSKSREVRFVWARKAFASSTLRASLSQPIVTATVSCKSAPLSLASINAAPSLANKRTLSLIARASRRRASYSRVSAHRNMRPTARSNSATVSSVKRVIVSRTVATRVA